ncbi:protein ARV 2 isoform X2 [Cannabis sativa]|uniref:protein ARV 2 isoform X2 n=1 Tax=Cannabis sativa TaxID=3483 RepID=UPI0011DFE490|nr:protein ARV 2 isoform X2 [Cannabis sativa]
MKYRCVECGNGMKSLFVQYSPGNIRLMKCENCKAVGDEYIECEIMGWQIVVIDLILHKPKAYRHLLYNVLDPQALNLQGLLWKCSFGFLLLDAYRSLLICRSKEEWSLSTSIDSFIWTCQKILLDVFLGNLMFFSTFVLAMRIFLGTWFGSLSSYKDILLAILISSYFKLCLLAMMVWEFPSSAVYIIDLYVFSSNTVALKVISKSPTSRCVLTCFSAHLMKFFITQSWS